MRKFVKLQASVVYPQFLVESNSDPVAIDTTKLVLATRPLYSVYNDGSYGIMCEECNGFGLVAVYKHTETGEFYANEEVYERNMISFSAQHEMEAYPEIVHELDYTIANETITE